MRILLALGVATLVASAGLASAQVSTTFQHYGYLGDEPNVASAGTLPYMNHPSETTAGYGPDVNGVAAARAGTPTLVLDAKLYAAPQGIVNAYQALAPFADLRGYLLPGAGSFVAFHGTWVDANEDGWITDPFFSGDAAHVNLAGRDCGADYLDPNAAQPLRCAGADEWVGLDGERVVGYVTPYVPTETQPANRFGDTQTRGPDLVFTNIALPWGGHYSGPDSGWDLVFVDNSILETTAVEVISSPALTSDGPRSHVLDADGLQDTDVYRAVDPSAEALYQTVVLAPLVGAGFDPDHPENAAGLSALDGEPAATDAADVAVGPAKAPFFAREEREMTDTDFSTAHVYFDADLAWSRYVALYVGGGDGRLLDDASGSSLSLDGSGDADAPLYAGVYARLGAWRDVSGDGFVGDPEPSPGCPDEYDCGDVADPNRWDTEAADVAAEWTPACRAVPYGHVSAWLTSSTGAWGAGVYVLDDRTDPFFGGPLDPQFPYSPWDDVVTDAADGSVDHLVLTGPLAVDLRCGGTFGLGNYYSFQHFLFPASNLGFDVILETEAFTVDLTSAGVAVPETVSDRDVTTAWSP